MLEDAISRMYAGARPSSARVTWLNDDARFSDEADFVSETGELLHDEVGQAASDPQLTELLTLAGALEIARGGWLCRIAPDGSLGRLMAWVGTAPRIEIAHVVRSFRGLINLSNADHPFQWLAAGREYLICDIGHDNAGRIVLVLRSRMLLASEWTTIKAAAKRVQGLVQIALSLSSRTPAVVEQAKPAETSARPLSDLCPFGIVIIDADQRIHLANPAATSLFARSSLIASAGGKFAISDADNAVRFQVALRAVLAAQSGEAIQRSVAVLDDRVAPLLLRIARYSDGAAEPKACVIITDPAVTKIDVQPLAQVFALTPVETRLVRELVLGRNVQEAALNLHLKVDTARTYLKQIFQKTNTHRQLELVQLMQNGSLPSVTTA